MTKKRQPMTQQQLREQAFEQFLPDERFQFWWPLEKRGKIEPGKFQDAFIKYLAQIPSAQWTDYDMDLVNMLRRQSGDAFWKRLASGTAYRRRRKSKWHDTKKFLFENWKEPRFPNRANLPGLRKWRPCAVMSLLRHMKKLRPKQFHHGAGEKWYCRFRRKLNLKPEPPYKVKGLPREVSQLPIELLLRSPWQAMVAAEVERVAHKARRASNSSSVRQQLQTLE